MGDGMISATANFLSALSTFRNGKILYIITIAGYSKVFTNYASGVAGQVPWLRSLDDSSTSINDLDGGADQVSVSFIVQDRLALITADFPSFTFEGKQVTIQMGLPGLAQADFVTIFTGFIDTVASANKNADYYFTCNDISSQLSQVIYLTGDDGQPISSDHPKTLLAHPLDLMTNILSVQVGLAGGLIDTTKINNYRDGVFSGIQFQFHLTQSVTASDFIKNQLLKPLGGYLWVNSLGAITVNFFYPLSAPSPIATLGPKAWLTIPEAEQLDIINTVQFQFDKDDATADASGNYLAQDTEIYGPSVAKYGTQFGEQTISADGLRSGFQGFFTARMVSRMIFGRYGLKNLKFDQAAPDSIWATCLLEPGDIIAITHPQVPDRTAGVMGVTNKLFEILNRTFKFSTGTMNFTMLDASYLSTFGLFKISPDGQADYTAGSNTYMYLCDDTDKYTNGDAAHTLG
jgi:hypothetical protein